VRERQRERERELCVCESVARSTEATQINVVVLVISHRTMEQEGLAILTGPVDHMRQGFSSFEQSHLAQHPIRLLQNRAEQEWKFKLDTIRRTQGSHMAMRLATERAMMDRMRRLPGLAHSTIGLQTVIGTDEQIDFQDFLNGTLAVLMSVIC
jgi:hypothetical protein